MAGRQMTIERLEAIIASYGSDPERWPEAERQSANVLLDDGAAGTALRDEAALDVLLDSTERPQPSNMLKANLLEGAADALTPRIAPTSANRSGWTLRLFTVIDDFVNLKPLALGSMLAPVMALGIWLGASLSSDPVGEEELFAAFGEDYELWTENDVSLSTEEPGGT